METGVGIPNPLFFIGVVENRNDPRVEGRVQVRAFGIHGTITDIPTEDLPWATLIIGNHDVNFTPPPLNAWVFGFFIDGRDAQQPMILGLIPTQTNELINPAVTGWGAVPLEDYDRQMQGSRPKDLGLSPMGNLATGEFLNETYNQTLMSSRKCDIPVAGGITKNYAPGGNGNAWSIEDANETDPSTPRAQPRPSEQQIYDGLRARGFNDIEARGIIANMIAESGLDPGINEIAPLVSGSRGGYGLIQWTGPRRRALEAEAARRGVPVNNVDFQLDYLALEMQTTERSSRTALSRTSTPAEAARVFSDTNLRPGIPNMPKRVGEAQRLETVDFSRGVTAVEQQIDTPATKTDEIRQRIAQIDKQLAELDGRPLDTLERQAKETLLKEREELEAQLQTENTIITDPGPYAGYKEYDAIGKAVKWCEPESAYGAQYPYNRVIQTASGHSIEVDDTPGAERIMIWHQSGSYIQIANDSVTHKKISDSYEINEQNHHIYIGGTNIVTIEGDSYVLVKGNKTEEIQGDYKQIVHGNIMIGGAKKIELNGADRTDIRSASIGLDSNVENLQFKTKKNIILESGDSISLQSKNIRIGSSQNTSIAGNSGLFLQSTSGSTHIKSQGSIFVNPENNLYMTSDSGTVSIQAKGSFNVNSDTFITMKSASTFAVKTDSNLILGSEGSININALGDKLSLKSSGLYLDGSGSVDINSSGKLRMSGASETHINATTVFIDGDSIKLAEGSEAAEVKEALNPPQFEDAFDGKATEAESPATATSDSRSSPTPPKPSQAASDIRSKSVTL